MSTKLKFKTSSYDLKLTRQELIHLRDLFSVLLPPDGESTLSEQLAAYKDRQTIEHSLWEKIYELCLKTNVSTDSKAPDFIVTLTSMPNITIVELPKTAEDAKRVYNSKQQEEQRSEVNNKELFDMITLKKG
jgi:hypothetical protein